MRGDDTQTVEVEWQFDAPDLVFVAEWLERGNHGGFTVRALPPERLTDHYVDTTDSRLYRAGFSVRIRRKNRRCELTLKSRSRESNGPLVRTEHTVPVRGTTPAHALAARGEPGDLLRAIAGNQALLPLFTIQTHRQRYGLFDSTGTALGEIDLDSTTIRDGETPLALMQRIEVELAPGSTEDARDFVDRLRRNTSLAPARTSKLGTAMEAAGRAPFDPAAAIGHLPRLTATMPIGEAIRSAVGTQLLAILENEPATRAGLDPEALHDMRVAARRARTLLHVFGPAAGIEAATLARELRWLARILGAVRDLDVQSDRLRLSAATLPPAFSTAVDGVIVRLAEQRSVARRAMLEALDSVRYEHIQSLLLRYVQGRPCAGDSLTDEPAAAAASRLIRRRFRRVAQAASRITPESPPEKLHALRKDLRRLRYVVDFAAPMAHPALERWRPRLVALQDVLGDHQDAIVSVEVLAGMATGGQIASPETIFALGMLAERNQQAAIRHRGEFADAFSRFRGRRWRAANRALRGATGS